MLVRLGNEGMGDGGMGEWGTRIKNECFLMHSPAIVKVFSMVGWSVLLPTC